MERIYHWKVRDRMTGETCSRHVYHDDAERRRKSGDRYVIVPINQDLDDPYRYRANPARELGRLGGLVTGGRKADAARINGRKGGRPKRQQ